MATASPDEGALTFLGGSFDVAADTEFACDDFVTASGGTDPVAEGRVPELSGRTSSSFSAWASDEVDLASPSEEAPFEPDADCRASCAAPRCADEETAPPLELVEAFDGAAPREAVADAEAAEE